ncbi:MAG: ABC transporter substrate-binding protein [Halioglobus sp.]|nr:ABC transporter substrate-binding protein [Halioglobus sp.]
MLPFLAALSAQANTPTQDAYELVGETTQRVMDTVSAANDYVDTDPERYYVQVQSILDPLIDYRGFARSVMGPYASSKRYRALDEAGRAQLREQLDRFTEVMRLSLVRTYSKGLLAFGGSRIEIVPPAPGEDDTSRASVRQHVFADRDEPYVVLYQMGKDSDGDWKLRNVIIESVNLGEIYRDQFQAAAREEAGNLDKVIASWTTVTVDVDS